jgi:ferredoxin
MASQWEIDVNVHHCVGSGVCAGAAPTYFIVGNDHKSRPRSRAVEPDERPLEAAIICPMEAITIVEAGTGRSIFPDAG